MCRTRHHGDKKYGPNCIEKKQAIIARRRSDCTEVQAQFCDYQEMKDPIDIPFGPFGIPVDTYVSPKADVQYIIEHGSEDTHLTQREPDNFFHHTSWFEREYPVYDFDPFCEYCDDYGCKYCMDIDSSLLAA
jgi:hypothetical protein